MATITPTPAPVSASIVANNARLDFLPFYFGVKHMMLGEGLVYARMSKLCTQYKGGDWEFYTLSNGGFYMAPSHPAPMSLFWAENHSAAVVQADAAGIIATLFALNELAFALHDQPGEAGDHFAEAYHQLRDFALFHPEADAIFRIID